MRTYYDIEGIKMKLMNNRLTDPLANLSLEST